MAFSRPKLHHGQVIYALTYTYPLLYAPLVLISLALRPTCFTPFCFNTPCKYTPRLNLRPSFPFKIFWLATLYYALRIP